MKTNTEALKKRAKIIIKININQGQTNIEKVRKHRQTDENKDRE